MEMINMKFDHQDTELRLGLPGSNAITCNKRLFSKISEESTSNNQDDGAKTIPPAPKVQIMGWPPVRSYRKNCLQTMKKEDGIFVKVSMDGAPYLRKIDMKLYNNYSELLKALEVMFKVEVGKYSDREGYKGSTYVPTYEDKDGDWMLVGDVPWEMFIGSCKRLRIMKGSEARGLGCMA